MFQRWNADASSPEEYEAEGEFIIQLLMLNNNLPGNIYRGSGFIGKCAQEEQSHAFKA